jgi:teichuronic acid biosynthesis protein TuaE
MDAPGLLQFQSDPSEPKRHRYNVMFSIIIIALFAGGLGGSFQPARILVSLAIIYAAMTGIRFGAEARLLAYGLILAAVLVLLGTISLAWTTDLYGGVGLIFAVGVGLGSLVIAGNMDRSIAGLTWIIWAWVIVIGLTIPMAFYEIATGNHFAYAFEARNLGGDLGEFPFASALFGNYNDYSVFLCMSYPFVCSALMITRFKIFQIILLFLVFSIFAIIFTNTSRAAMAFLLFYTVLLFVFLPKFRSIFLLPSALLVILVIYRFYQNISQIISLIQFRIEATNALDESTIQRIGIFWAGIDAIRSNYGISIGVGGFDEFMSDYYSYYIPNPHNIFLEIAVNFGIPALIVFLFWLTAIFIVALRRSDLPSEYRLQVIFCVPMIPIVGIIGSQAIGYIYWWVWLVSLAALASAWTQQSSIRYAAADREANRINS